MQELRSCGYLSTRRNARGLATISEKLNQRPAHRIQQASVRDLIDDDTEDIANPEAPLLSEAPARGVLPKAIEHMQKVYGPMSEAQQNLVDLFRGNTAPKRKRQQFALRQKLQDHDSNFGICGTFKPQGVLGPRAAASLTIEELADPMLRPPAAQLRRARDPLEEELKDEHYNKMSAGQSETASSHGFGSETQTLQLSDFQGRGLQIESSSLGTEASTRMMMTQQPMKPRKQMTPQREKVEQARQQQVEHGEMLQVQEQLQQQLQQQYAEMERTKEESRIFE